ncbi:helix-turn-helix domain-containing protein [Chryseobacterium sp. CKR4-1]|uniref:winged helix-turn-helix transcriptional regulator n=1 Tax=Chryseobacterium sp. CKR4-1 TaxID=3068896 RepID=UPI0027965B59|nr:helix-turn-helix domain-containing protein [Chryseobacterium sp. CKR4-1]MDQ1805077.1 helix-turn-helix domain-containing protein [Chryseobacterium sp. CKR4-1]
MSKKINCPVRKAMDMIGSKWKMKIIEALSKDNLRYGEIKRKTEGISEKMLIQELKTLVEYEIISRKDFKQIPPHVEYSLTNKGREVLPIIEDIIAFGLKNL